MTKNSAGKAVPGDMLIFTAGHPPIYGRQILYFADPVFSPRAKIKAPGVSEGWSRGMSDSLYFDMPLTIDGENSSENEGEKNSEILANLVAQATPDFEQEYRALLH